MQKLRVALCQLAVGKDKKANVDKAVSMIERAKKEFAADVVILPECFNSPYGSQFFAEYAEEIRADNVGPSMTAVSEAAKRCGVYLVAGSIPEKDGANLHNTSVSFGNDGSFLGKFRKMHLFRINTETVKFDEGETLTAGNTFLTFPVGPKDGFVFGTGICFDIRYPEFAAHNVLRLGANVLVYPGAFNMVTGPPHWLHAARSRAVDNQCFVCLCSPARDVEAGYVAYGHSVIVDPWGEVVASLDEKEGICCGELDLAKVNEVRRRLPITSGHRGDIQEFQLKEGN